MRAVRAVALVAFFLSFSSGAFAGELGRAIAGRAEALVGLPSVAAVARDVPDYGVAVGNPARVVKERARIRYTYVPSSVQRAPSIE